MKLFKPDDGRWGAPIRGKYEMFDMEDGSNLYRIRAIRDIPLWGVKAGDFGGLIESECNLLTFGDAWIGKDAKVTGNARIHFGHVNGTSHVFGDVLLRRGIITDSIVCGDADIDGDFLFLNSNIINGEFLGAGTMVDSALENVSLVPLHYDAFALDNVHVVSKEPFRAQGKQIWSDVSLNVNGGQVTQALEMRDSELNIELFQIFQKTEIAYISANNLSLRLTTGRHYASLDPIEEVIVMKGLSKTEPLTITADYVTVYSSIIEGNLSLAGILHIEDSTILDYASIDYFGLLENVKVSELALLKSIGRNYTSLKDTEITGDAVYKML